ncbi:DNA-binding response regulator [Clostridia bacterium]|nr:DNA-binding response regulator [Clostridia bacterium]
MPKVLVVEDEAKIARFLELELTHEGYQVKAVGDGRMGLTQATDWKPDIMILDLMLPGLSGIEVCRRIRQQEKGSRLPILMLTAKDDISDKVMGLDMGADDYMTKPFAIEEVLARLRVMTARKERGKTASEETLASGGLTLTPRSHEATLDGQPLTLTKKEYDLLLCLMRHADEALTRDFLLENVWGYSYDGDNNVVDVYVRYLRNKIDSVSGDRYIHTIRGVGYMFRFERDTSLG